MKKLNAHFKDKNIFLITLIFTITHCLIFIIPNAQFWDDWYLTGINTKTLLRLYNEAGSMFNFFAWLHIGMLKLGLPFYRFFTFFLYLASTFLFYKIVKRQNFIQENDKFLLVILFAILPLNFSRVTLITFGYTVCFFAFFLGWFLIKKHKIMSTLLFIISFNLQSLLVFFLLPFLEVYFSTKEKTKKTLIYLGLLSLLPFVWFYIKVKIYSPFGEFETYNQIYSIENLTFAINNFITNLDSIKFTITDFRRYSKLSSLPSLFSLILLILSFLTAYFFSKKMFKTKNEDLTIPYSYIFLTILCLILATFPYFILGISPSYYNFNSRHQILMPIGVALLFLSMIKIILKINKIFSINLNSLTIKIYFVTILIGLSMLANWCNYINSFYDWRKQKLLIDFFSNSDEIQNSDLILFSDQTNNMNNRSYKNYELTGMVKKSFKNEDKFFITPGQLSAYQNGEFDHLFIDYWMSNNHIRKENPSIVRLNIRGTAYNPIFNLEHIDISANK